MTRAAKCMAFRRPVLLLCIVSIVLGISFDDEYWDDTRPGVDLYWSESSMYYLAQREKDCAASCTEHDSDGVYYVYDNCDDGIEQTNWVDDGWLPILFLSLENLKPPREDGAWDLTAVWTTQKENETKGWSEQAPARDPSNIAERLRFLHSDWCAGCTADSEWKPLSANGNAEHVFLSRYMEARFLNQWIVEGHTDVHASHSLDTQHKTVVLNSHSINLQDKISIWDRFQTNVGQKLNMTPYENHQETRQNQNGFYVSDRMEELLTEMCTSSCYDTQHTDSGFSEENPHSASFCLSKNNTTYFVERCGSVLNSNLRNISFVCFLIKTNNKGINTHNPKSKSNKFACNMQRFCIPNNTRLSTMCRLVSGNFKERKQSKLEKRFSVASLVFTVAVLADNKLVQKIKPLLHAVCSTTSLRQLIQTAINGQALIDTKTKEHYEHNTPLWRRFSTFTPTPPVFYTVYPATSFLPGVGSSGRDAMTHMGCRLASLAALPASCNVSRSRLAQAGFYYDSSKTSRNSSNNHEVVCFSCGVTWSSWEASDNPMVIHRGLRPDCNYIKSQGPDVFPQSTYPPSISSGPSSLSSLSTFSTDSTFSSLSSASSMTSWSSSSTESSQASSVFGFGGSSDQGDLATDCASIAPAPLPLGHVTSTNQSWSERTYSSLLSTIDRLQSSTSARNTLAYFEDRDDRAELCMDSAVYPQFSTVSERLATFQGWPLGQYFRPDDLVYDGFYYAGYADCLRCFHCGVGLKSWDRNDSVMDEHIRWRPTCGYILAVKGRRFVNRTLERLQAARPDEGSESTTNGARNSSADVVRNGASPNEVISTAQTSTSTIGSATVPTNTNGSTSQRTASNTSIEAVQRAKEMGFSEEFIARATRALQQPEASQIDTTVFIEYLTDLTTVPNNDTRQSPVNGDLHTDGAHALEGDTGSQHAQEVMRENERLRSMRRCKLCNRGTVGVIFMPCGHLLACTECAGRTRNCTRCGQYIRATANVYLSPIHLRGSFSS